MRSNKNIAFNSRFLLTTIVVAFTTAAMLLPTPSQAQDFVPGEVMVSVREDMDDDAEAQRLTVVGDVLERLPHIHVYRVKLPISISVEAAILLLEVRPEVEVAEPNYISHIGSTPNDYYYSHNLLTGYPAQYGPTKIQANLAWGIWQPRQQIVIAILDTGIDDTHPDLTNKMYVNSSGTIIGKNENIYNYKTTNSTGTLDDNGHGTHCAGVAAAQINNTSGI